MTNRGTRIIATAFAAGAPLLLAGCGSPPEIARCELSMHEIAEDGALVQPAVIAARHVAAMAPAQEAYSGEQAWEVQLTPEGAAINRRFTREQTGRPIAILCNGREVARPMVMEESGDRFVFAAAAND